MKPNVKTENFSSGSSNGLSNLQNLNMIIVSNPYFYKICREFFYYYLIFNFYKNLKYSKLLETFINSELIFKIFTVCYRIVWHKFNYNCPRQVKSFSVKYYSWSRDCDVQWNTYKIELCSFKKLFSTISIGENVLTVLNS